MRWLFYVKGGGAWMNVRYGQALVNGGFTAGTQTVTDTRSGFTAGAGIEYGLTENFSARLEYDFYDFGTQTYNQFVQTPISIKSDMHALTFGLNYRFNWALTASRSARPAEPGFFHGQISQADSQPNQDLRA